jgi:hypothetical protein
MAHNDSLLHDLASAQITVFLYNFLHPKMDSMVATIKLATYILGLVRPIIVSGRDI